MQRRFRLTSSEDFRRVRQSGKAHAHPLLVLIAAPNQLSHSRVGVAASKRVGGAVSRNRARRRLRHAMQPHLDQLYPGWDLVLIARPALIDAGWPRLQQAVAGLLRRAGCLRTTNQ
jgi:ribonuclease P protein component